MKKKEKNTLHMYHGFEFYEKQIDESLTDFPQKSVVDTEFEKLADYEGSIIKKLKTINELQRDITANVAYLDKIHKNIVFMNPMLEYFMHLGHDHFISIWHKFDANTKKFTKKLDESEDAILNTIVESFFDNIDVKLDEVLSVGYSTDYMELRYKLPEKYDIYSVTITIPFYRTPTLQEFHSVNRYQVHYRKEKISCVEEFLCCDFDDRICKQKILEFLNNHRIK